MWKNPEPPPIPASLMLSARRGAELAQKDGEPPFEKTDFKLFPCFHVVGLPPAQIYTHTMMPLGPGRTRGTIRMYWTREAENASRLFTREFNAMAVRDVLSEDRLAVEAGQRGIAGGAIGQVHFQDHEMLLRHLYETVVAKVEAYRADSRSAES